MSDKPKAFLIAEIGSAITRVTLVDTVAGEMRMIAQAEVASTTEPPFENAVIGILEAAAQISEMTGRQLLQDDGTLLRPQTPERDGVNNVLVTTSAAGQMGLVITAVASEVSARSALHASRATYTNVLQVVTLDDTHSVSNVQEASWIERQVQTLVGQRPDAVLMTGGLDGGTVDALVRLGHIIGVTALNVHVDDDGQQRHNVAAHPVIFAGNSDAREAVIEALSGRAEITVVENVRPSLEVERLDPTRQALIRRYNENILPNLPGMNVIRRLSSRQVATTADVTGLITRFIAQQYQRAVLTLDVGSANTSAFLASQGRYSPTVMGGIGVGYSAAAVLAERGITAIMRWLPFPISERDLTHWILNKMIRPHVVPSTREDVLIEHALAREALIITLRALWDERPTATYDYVVAGGGVLVHSPYPGLAALTILDALQPDLDQTELAVELHLDQLGMIPVAGTMATVDTDAALTLIERDFLSNTPLATCVVALGEGKFGDLAIEAELVPLNGNPIKVQVKHGEIVRLPLAPGQKGTLTLRPSSTVRVGLNAPGKEVASQLAAISGSTLGVVIDARGRPLALPASSSQRQQLLWDWMVAMGAASGPLPYGMAEPLPEEELLVLEPEQTELVEQEVATPVVEAAVVTPEAAPKKARWGFGSKADKPAKPEKPKREKPAKPEKPAKVKPGKEPKETVAAPVEPPAPAISNSSGGEDDSLARLRQTVEAPKKRGFFRKK